MRRSDQASLPGLGPAEAPRGPPHRLFFALWPDAPLREALADTTASLLQAHPTDGRRLRPDRYHLTLQFLGDIFAPRREDVVARAMRAAAQVDVPAFDLVLDQAGGFANARVWWLAPGTVPEGLHRLWDALGVALLHAGQKPKASPGFSPHLTIVRDTGARLPATPVAPLRWRVDRFVLVDSQPPKPYKLVGEWPLRA
ncbi:MAG: RNA 2',3'-cyclic phosphodiesterase [Lysobacteraceae bacterium]